MSFGIGAAAGAAGDKWSLGFVAATEEQVDNFKKAFSVCLEAKDYMVKY